MTALLGLFAIVSYRDFYDVPRVMLAVDESSRYWVFDCAFDDELDDYPSEYKIHFVGNDPEKAEEAMMLHLANKNAPAESSVPVARLEFDHSKRRAFTIVEL